MSPRQLLAISALALAGLGAVALGDTPPVIFANDQRITTPADPADALRAQLHRERRAHAAERRRLARKVRRTSVELRRIRAGGTAFTVEDTFLAARLVAVIGGWPEAGALRVARCESHYQPWAQNAEALGGSHATGSWQVLWPSTWRSTPVGRAFPSEAAARNPYLNAFAAFEVYRRHGSFVEWADVCGSQGDGR